MTALPVPSSDAYAGDINEPAPSSAPCAPAAASPSCTAWVYVDGAVTNFNTLIPPGSGLHIAYANAVNNEGQIAATAFDAQGHYHAVLLTPGEDPSPRRGSRSATCWLSKANTSTQTASFP